MAFYPRASLARTVFSFKAFFDPSYRPPTPVLVSEVKWKWSVFGPLFFLKLIYIIDHIYTFIATRGKCAQQLSYGSKVRDKLGSWLKNFQKHPRGEGFWKNGLQLVDPRGYFWGQISELIFFRKKFKGISFVKLKASWINF